MRRKIRCRESCNEPEASPTPHQGPGAQQGEQHQPQFQHELEEITAKLPPEERHWHPGEAPSQVLIWAVEALPRAGTLAIIGSYPPTAKRVLIGEAMNNNLTMKVGICLHLKYKPHLLEMVCRK